VAVSLGAVSISDSTGTLESLSYLGLSTVVIRNYSQAGTQLTYVKLSGESNGDAGDQYTGLDRFGRVVDQRWIVTTTGAALDRWQYGYDRDGNVLYSNNLVNSSFSELYHANGAGNDYDNLNQLTNFARGTPFVGTGVGLDVDGFGVLAGVDLDRPLNRLITNLHRVFVALRGEFPRLDLVLVGHFLACGFNGHCGPSALELFHFLFRRIILGARGAHGQCGDQATQSQHHYCVQSHGMPPSKAR
jgi:hypothetical protein